MRQVLLIDDDELFCEFVTDAAELVGVSVVALDNGNKIQEYDAYQFEHILLDLTVPGADGIQLLRYLKNKEYQGKVSIASGCEQAVLTSAHQLGENYGLNMTPPLSKPFPLESLLNLLRDSGQATSLSKNVTQLDVEDDSDSDLLPALTAAIENEEIKVYFQPRFDLNSKRLLGVEALARWILDDGQFIPPSIFIPLAEENDLIEALTKSVVEQVLPQMAEWNRKGIRIQASFNFSAKSLHELDFPDYLSALAEQYGLLPQQIVVELTESALVDDIASSMEILTRIRMKGFGLSIDDFGTGYSSVQQLQNIPFNELKIDRSFVSNFETKLQARTIIESTIEMAHKLGILVIAEGIENQAAIDYLKSIGCDQGQGFYYAKPMSAEEFAKWIKVNPSYFGEEQVLDNEFVIAAVDDDIDFIELLSDLLSEEFNFKPYTNTQQFLEQFPQIKPDIVLLDVNMPSINGYKVCQQIRETDVKDLSVIFISGADNKEQRLKAFSAGGDDFIAKPISVGELLAKLRNLRKFQESKENLFEQEAMARDMAFQSMTEASQYGSILRFFKDSFQCRNQSQLVTLFYQLMADLQLSACIQLRTTTKKYSFRSPNQQCSPMEENLFEMLSDSGRLYHFKSRTMVNDKHVSMLIKNMPVEDEVTYGRYNDLIAALIEGLESKWSELIKDDSTSELVINIDQVLMSLRGKFDQFEKETHDVIDMLILDVRSSLHVLDLSEEQENYLIDMIEKGVERVMKLGDAGREIEDDFSHIIEQFKTTYD